MLAQITSSYFCVGIVPVNDRVTEAAPIVWWMVGKTRDQVRAHCVAKGWTVLVVEDRKC